MLEEIKELKDKINDLERRAMFIQDYNLVVALLRKLNIDRIEISKEEIERYKSVFFVVEREEDKVIIREEPV